MKRQCFDPSTRWVKPALELRSREQAQPGELIATLRLERVDLGTKVPEDLSERSADPQSRDERNLLRDLEHPPATYRHREKPQVRGQDFPASTVEAVAVVSASQLGGPLRDGRVIAGGEEEVGARNCLPEGEMEKVVPRPSARDHDLMREMQLCGHASRKRRLVSARLVGVAVAEAGDLGGNLSRADEICCAGRDRAGIDPGAQRDRGVAMAFEPTADRFGQERTQMELVVRRRPVANRPGLGWPEEPVLAARATIEFQSVARSKKLDLLERRAIAGEQEYRLREELGVERCYRVISEQEQRMRGEANTVAVEPVEQPRAKAGRDRRKRPLSVVEREEGVISAQPSGRARPPAPPGVQDEFGFWSAWSFTEQPGKLTRVVELAKEHRACRGALPSELRRARAPSPRFETEHGCTGERIRELELRLETTRRGRQTFTEASSCLGRLGRSDPRAEQI